MQPAGRPPSIEDNAPEHGAVEEGELVEELGDHGLQPRRLQSSGENGPLMRARPPPPGEDDGGAPVEKVLRPGIPMAAQRARLIATPVPPIVRGETRP